jgi:hypothetical protein
MKIQAVTIEAFFTSIPEKEGDLRALDALILEILPNVARRLKITPSITLLAYWPENIPEAEWPPIGFAPQKNHISLYVNGWKDGESIVEHFGDHLGKTSNGKGCIRFKKTEDLSAEGLRQVLKAAVSPEWQP